MDAKTRLEIFQRFEQHNPNPTTELKYQTDFELLVAVMLSAQATDASVNKATEKLFQVARTPEQMVALEAETTGGVLTEIGILAVPVQPVEPVTSTV